MISQNLPSLSLTQANSNEEIRKIASSCSIAVMVTIMIILIFGRSILGFFGISVASFRVGGGYILLPMSPEYTQSS